MRDLELTSFGEFANRMPLQLSLCKLLYTGVGCGMPIKTIITVSMMALHLKRSFFYAKIVPNDIVQTRENIMYVIMMNMLSLIALQSCTNHRSFLMEMRHVAHPQSLKKCAILRLIIAISVCWVIVF